MGPSKVGTGVIKAVGVGVTGTSGVKVGSKTPFAVFESVAGSAGAGVLVGEAWAASSVAGGWVLAIGAGRSVRPATAGLRPTGMLIPEDNGSGSETAPKNPLMVRSSKAPAPIMARAQIPKTSRLSQADFDRVAFEREVIGSLSLAQGRRVRPVDRWIKFPVPSPVLRGC